MSLLITIIRVCHGQYGLFRIHTLAQLFVLNNNLHE
jgi:hypothetical protein